MDTKHSSEISKQQVRGLLLTLSSVNLEAVYISITTMTGDVDSLAEV
jgi:hypothetical protein